MSNSFTCAYCGYKDIKTISDQQAKDEYEALYKTEWNAEEVLLVCSDCYALVQSEQTEKPVVQ